MRGILSLGLPGRIFSSTVVGLLLVLAGGLFLGGALRTTHASSPAIQISPNSGPYHTVTVVTGQGFAPHEQVAIYKELARSSPMKPTPMATSLARLILSMAPAPPTALSPSQESAGLPA